MPPEFDNIKVKIKIPQMYILKSHKHNILFITSSKNNRTIVSIYTF